MSDQVTVVIAARNAAATIQRCVRSVVREGKSIVLVDDHSTDGTATLACAAGGSRLRVVSPMWHDTIGRARQAGIDAVTTRVAMWVDANDEVVPGRAERLLARMEDEGADLVFDSADLHDGPTGAFVRHLPLPEYARRDPAGVRQFERNVIPSIGWPLVRTSWAQRIGYDVTCHGVEDYDFLLRSCMEGARLAYEPVPGYRQFAYACSVSRHIANRRSGVRDLLKKHEYQLIRARFGAAGHDPAIAAWALVAVAIYREDWGAAAGFLDVAARGTADPLRVLEADGPCAHPEGWRLGFYRGTVALLNGRLDEARRELARAHAVAPAAESANNLGVALARLGFHREAGDLFTEALDSFPGYLDATHNRATATPSSVTTHPLRRSPARIEYPAADLHAARQC